MSWANSAAAITFLKAFNTDYNGLSQCIVVLGNGNRPNVDCYFPAELTNMHLTEYVSGGGSAFVPAYWSVVGNFSQVGVPGSGQWVSPYSVQTDLLNGCPTAGDPTGTCILSGIGITPSNWSMFEWNRGNTGTNRVLRINIDTTNIQSLNLRMPNGNEVGANNLWLPGGYTSGGLSEAIVDVIPMGKYCWDAVADANGVYCWNTAACRVDCNYAKPVKNCAATACSQSSAVSFNRKAWNNAIILNLFLLFMIATLWQKMQ
jgi:hypothetical protein